MFEEEIVYHSVRVVSTLANGEILGLKSTLTVIVTSPYDLVEATSVQVGTGVCRLRAHLITVTINCGFRIAAAGGKEEQS